MATREINRYWLDACLGLALVAMAPAQETGIKGPIPKEDIRVVNGRVVDVAPVHRWLQTREGERPLPHWQSFQILEIKRVVAGLHHCVAKQENGRTVELLVANLPAHVHEFFRQARQLQTQVQTAQAALEREQRRLEEIDATVPAKTGAPSWYEDAWTRRRYEVDRAMVRVKHAKEDLAKLQGTLDRMMAEAPERAGILAMRSGREYLGLPVWDCGVSKKQPRL